MECRNVQPCRKLLGIRAWTGDSERTLCELKVRGTRKSIARSVDCRLAREPTEKHGSTVGKV